jgi:hypothetical protein
LPIQKVGCFSVRQLADSKSWMLFCLATSQSEKLVAGRVGNELIQKVGCFFVRQLANSKSWMFFCAGPLPKLYPESRAEERMEKRISYLIR